MTHASMHMYAFFGDRRFPSDSNDILPSKFKLKGLFFKFVTAAGP